MEILAGVRPSFVSAQQGSRIELAPYRSQIFANTWSRKQLPMTVAARNAVLFQHATQPLANSVNWKNSLCTLMGLDGNTPPASPTANYLTAHPSSLRFLAREGEFLYVVPADQPRRQIVDQDAVLGVPTQRFQAVVNRLGGLPIPLDAKPGPNPDRYAGFYSPDTNTLINLYAFGTTDPATTTLRRTGPLSSGDFQMTITYGDNGLAQADFMTTLAVPFNATAAQVKASVDSARNAVNQVISNGSGTACVATGGPLNTADVVLSFGFGDPLMPVTIKLRASTLAPSSVAPIHHNAGPYDRCRLGAIITPSTDGSVGGVDTFSGTYSTKQDRVGAVWMDPHWNATAANIEQYGLMPSWEEAQAANEAGTGVGHCLPFILGHAQGAPIPYVYPASSGDGDRFSSPSHIAEGARIAFPPDTDLSYIQANCPEALFLVRTGMEHGFVPFDKSGLGCSIILRRAVWQGDPAFNPWISVLPRYVTQGSGAAEFYMKALPWHKAQIIDPSYSR